MDQASTLRQIVGGHSSADQPRRGDTGHTRVISITSGKGGVGKTNIVINLCLALQLLKRRVFLLDADMGLANVDVLLGLTPQYTLEHVFKGDKRIDEILITGPHGLKLLPSSSGMSELSEMTFEQQMFLFQQLSQIDDQIDYLFIDTGAGISSNVLRFNASANEVLVVATPEPTSITDAYALMKLLAIKYHIREFSLVVNSVESEREGRAVYNRLRKACQQFLQVNLTCLGSLPFDQHIRKAVRQQRPAMDLFPTSPACRGVIKLAETLDASHQSESPAVSMNDSDAAPASFWDRLLHWKKAR